MKRCTNCNHAWNNRKPNPLQCPKCHTYLTSQHNPNGMAIPLGMIEDEKKRHIRALHKFTDDQSHAHGVQEGWIEAMIWIESQIKGA
jgi:hypothetical protein